MWKVRVGVETCVGMAKGQGCNSITYSFMEMRASTVYSRHGNNSDVVGL